jgi:hypothetical protein
VRRESIGAKALAAEKHLALKVDLEPDLAVEHGEERRALMGAI